MRKKEGPPRAVQLQFALAEGGDTPVLGGRKIADGAESAVDNVLARAAGAREDLAAGALSDGVPPSGGVSMSGGAGGQSAAEGGGDSSARRMERYASSCDLVGGAAKGGFVCAVTGHRVLSSDFSKEELRAALRALAAAGVRTFLCGMALGFDLLCAEEVLLLREELPVRLVACIPCADQAARYPKSARERYERILDRCDERAVLHERYCDGCMFERNRYMVDRADLLLAYFTGRRGGTKYTVGYAEKRGIPVYLIE